MSKEKEKQLELLKKIEAEEKEKIE